MSAPKILLGIGIPIVVGSGIFGIHKHNMMNAIQPTPPLIMGQVPEKFRKVTVFFGTDRQENQGQVPALRFGSRRSDSISYGYCDVSIPHDHRMSEMESPHWTHLQFQENPEKHIVVMNVSSAGKAAFIDSLKRRYLDSVNTALVFIHGFNVTFVDAARRTAQMTYDLGYKGAPVFFSWPSHGNESQYLADRANVEWAFSDISEFMVDFIRESKVENVILIAHSMGNLGALEMLQNMTAKYPEERGKIREIILAAPDIDADRFKNDIAPNILLPGTNITLYASSNDKALRLSKGALANGSQRLGDSHPVLYVDKSIETIDASNVETDFLAHSYFGDATAIINDIYYIVHDNKRAGYRAGLQAAQTPKGQYWKFRKVGT